MMLLSLGYKADEAINGEYALQKLAAKQTEVVNNCECNIQNYQMVFMDVNMPIMDGIETTKLIRKKIQSGELNQMSIVSCSAYVDLKTKQKVFEAGVDEFITKPIKMKELLEILIKFNI